MPQTIQIALVGDYSREVNAHLTIPEALKLAAPEVGCTLDFTWIGTQDLTGFPTAHETLGGYGGVWCVPGSPYKKTEGALSAIRWARENAVPFLGTCGGYQHAVLEYARNVLGYSDADNIETNPEASMPLIAPLVCSLVEQKGEIFCTPGSAIAKIQGSLQVTEMYHCSYGLNNDYASLFEGSDLRITGHDADGDPRVIEVQNHPFFIGTAYQPSRSATSGEAHPLIVAYVRAVVVATSNVPA